MKRFLLTVIIAVAISSFTLWLMEHPIKYFFFTFQIILTATLAWIFIFPQFNIGPKLIHIKQNIRLLGHLQVSRLDCLFMFLSASLLLMNVFSLTTPVNILLAFVVVSLLPGYVLLRLVNVFNSTSYLEAFGLSYALSLALSGILPTLFAPIINQSNKLAFLGLLTFLSTLPILKDLVTRRTVSEPKTRLEVTPVRVLTLATVVGFFSIVIIHLYPQMSSVPGLDIIRNFSKARLWGLSPETLSPSYPFFYVYQAAIYSASSPSLEVYQTFLAFTSVGVVLSFYMVAKKYLDEIDSRLSGVATVFWAMFSGFGWIYLFGEKLGHLETPQMDLLRSVYDVTYADVGYGLSTNLWLWFIAMTASFTIFFTLLYLLKCKGIPKASLMLLTSVLVISLYFIHISELVMFVVLLLVLRFLGQRNDLRLHEALSSTFVGLIGTIIVSYCMFSSVLQMYVLYSLTALVGLAYLLNQLEWKGMSPKRRSQIIKIFAYALMVFSIAGCLSWFPLSATFSMKYVGDTFLVPWFFHPVRLGIVGLLGLLGMLIVAERYSQKAVAIFPFLFFAAFIAGRAISFVNVNLFYTGYWEWRFLFFSFAAASITSTLFLKHVKIEKRMPKESLVRTGFFSFLISILVLGGVSSTFLTIERRNFYTVTEYLLDENELDAISFLSSTFMQEEPSPLLTVTHRSASALEFVPSPWVDKAIQPVIWGPTYPEIPLTFIYNSRFPPPYIYLDQRDLDTIANTQLQNGYVAEEFLRLMAEVYADSRIKIYEVTEGVPPLPNGKSVLVFPSGEVSRNDLLASYILSFGGYNYTTMLDLDPMLLDSDTLLFPSDSITTADITELEISNRKKILILNLDGYGSLSRLLFESQEDEASIDAKSAGGIFIHSLANCTSGLTSVSELLFNGGIEFIIYNDARKINYISIVDDDHAAFWTSTGGVGTGKVSAPLLSNDSSTGIEGKDCLEMIIDEGDYKDWYIQHNYPTSQNWSSKDFTTMWWRGADSGQTIGILAAGSDWKNYFQYTFVDCFIGWRRLVIPLRRFMPHGEPGWNSIKILQIRSFNGGVAGTWYLDSVGLEDGNDASVEVATHKAVGEPAELSVFDGATQVPISLPQINSTAKIHADNLYFSDGTSTDKIFGEEYFGEARLEKTGDMYKIALSVKLPPESSVSSQFRFRVGYETDKMNATRLVMPEAEIPLPREIELNPLIQKEETHMLGWYADGLEKTPLVATQTFDDQIEVFYLNVYPIVRTAFSDGGASQDLLQILANLLHILGCQKYNGTSTSWVIEDDTPVFAFKEGLLKGNVSISAESIIPYEELNLSEVHISIDDSQVFLKDVVSLSIQNISGKITLSSQNVKIEDGRGFYALISADNPEISIVGGKISISALTSNSTVIDVEGSATAELSVKGSFFAYLRNPSIFNVGESSFREVYAFHSYLGQLRTLGEDLLIEGEVEFNLPLSDEYSVASDFTWNGIATREPPDFTWDELGSLRESIPYFILAIAIFSVVWLATQKRSFRIRVRFRRWEQSK